jgi:hypothetical protein
MEQQRSWFLTLIAHRQDSWDVYIGSFTGESQSQVYYYKPIKLHWRIIKQLQGKPYDLLRRTKRFCWWVTLPRPIGGPKNPKRIKHETRWNPPEVRPSEPKTTSVASNPRKRALGNIKQSCAGTSGLISIHEMSADWKRKYILSIETRKGYSNYQNGLMIPSNKWIIFLLKRMLYRMEL